MIETWVVIALLGSIVVGLFNIYQKYVINKGKTPLEVITEMHSVSVVLLIAVIPFTGLFFSFEMFALLITSGIINGVSFWLLAAAYREDALSLIAPLRGITPIFVAFIEPLVFSGVSYEISLVSSSIVVAIGIYVLLYEDSVMAPFRRLSGKGVSRAVVSAVIISFAVLIDRFAIVNTGVEPPTYAFYLMAVSLVSSVVIAQIAGERKILDSVIPSRDIIPLGFLRAGSVVLAFLALSLVEGTRVNIVWQIGTMVSAIGGGSLLREDDLLRKGIGALLILVAVCVVIVV